MTLPMRKRPVSHTLSFRLYVTGQTSSAQKARKALDALVADRNGQVAGVDVIDVLTNPDAAMRDNVFATPTLICAGGGPERRVVGDLSSSEKLRSDLIVELESAPA